MHFDICNIVYFDIGLFGMQSIEAAIPSRSPYMLYYKAAVHLVLSDRESIKDYGTPFTCHNSLGILYIVFMDF